MAHSRVESTFGLYHHGHGLRRVARVETMEHGACGMRMGHGGHFAEKVGCCGQVSSDRSEEREKDMLLSTFVGFCGYVSTSFRGLAAHDHRSSPHPHTSNAFKIPPNLHCSNSIRQ